MYDLQVVYTQWKLYLGRCLLYKEIATDVFRIVAFYIIRMLSIAIFIARFHDCTTSNRL